MAFQLTPRAAALASQVGKTPQLILEIDGFDEVFGALEVDKIFKYGDDNPDTGSLAKYGDSGLVYGGVIEDINSRAYVDTGGSTKQITQQMAPDRKSTTSITTFAIRLIDYNGEISELFRPGGQVADVLSRRATTYLGFKGAAHPEDSIRLLNGTVSEVAFGPGYCDLVLKSAEQFKRQDIFVKRNTSLSATLNSGATTATVESTAGFLNQDPGDGFETYLRINDEFIRYTGTTSTTFTGLSRGQFNTTAATHASNDDIESYYRLQFDDPIEAALKLMLSRGGSYATRSAIEFETFGPTTIANAVKFTSSNIQDELGLVEGDLVTITGATNGANNVTDAVIDDFGTLDDGSYIVLSGVSLVPELASSAQAAFKSKYDVLPDGCAMTPIDVDVAGHERWLELLSSSFVALDFRLKDTIDAKQFINEQVYFPQGGYALIRQARASVNYTVPPLLGTSSPRIDDTNVIDTKIEISRSTDENFYNSVAWRYNPDDLTDRYRTGSVTLSAESTNRIQLAGNKTLLVESDGIRKSGATTSFIDRQTTRFLDRYKFAAESLTAKINYETGFNVEVGDVVIFDGENLQVTDIDQGSREFLPRLMEVTNKSLSLQSGVTTLNLTNTAYAADGRYGVIGPASIVGSGSTTTVINVVRSYSTDVDDTEFDKWQDLLPIKVKIRSADFSYDHERIMTSFSSGNGFQFTVDSALPSAPLAGYIVEVAYYPIDNDVSVEALAKNAFVYFDPQATVVTGISSTSFTVSVPDAALFVVGKKVRIHNGDFTIYSPEATVDDITGVTITVDVSLGFTPAPGQFVELIGFSQDEGEPYRIF